MAVTLTIFNQSSNQSFLRLFLVISVFFSSIAYNFLNPHFSS
ncbi:MAG: hypothetical protein ACK47N_16365 [Microcystis sp.]|nr:hypothetical protein [Microcystis aeruginosa]